MHEDVFGLVGTTIDGRYRVDETIGEGGFGVVYRGWHLRFDHAIAIKCLKVPPHFTSEARQLFLENFRNEGKLLSTLSGQNLSIVRVYDFGVTPSPLTGSTVPYLVLEWLVGQDLETMLERHRNAYSEREALSLMRPAVQAIATAHAANPPIAHRDLKPANLFVGHGSNAPLKVLDFGIAKAMQAGETATMVATRTSSGFAAFSPGYGAPEQFNPGKEGYGATGPWTDVHALGLILVELVTGKPALDGTNQYALSLSAMSTTRPTPRARGVEREVSEDFEALCCRALALRPADRYQSAAELLDAMDALSASRTFDAAEMAPNRVPVIAASRTGSSANAVLEKAAPVALPNTLTPGLETAITIPRKPFFLAAARIRHRGMYAASVAIVSALGLFLAFDREPLAPERAGVEQTVHPPSRGDIPETHAVSQSAAIEAARALQPPSLDASMVEARHIDGSDKPLPPAAAAVAPKTQLANPRPLRPAPPGTTSASVPVLPLPQSQSSKPRATEVLPSGNPESAALNVPIAPKPVPADSAPTSKTAPHSDLADSPSREEILTAMSKVESSVRLCALRAASVTGIAEVALTVSGATGRITNAQVTGMTGPVASCIRRVVSTARFPRFSRESFSIRYPYRF